jgi:hypothetical protein
MNQIQFYVDKKKPGLNLRYQTGLKSGVEISIQILSHYCGRSLERFIRHLILVFWGSQALKYWV